MHVECMEDRHSALWRHLSEVVLRRQSTAPGQRQGTAAALSALLKGMTDYSVSSSLGNWASYGKKGVFLPSRVHDCPHFLEVVGSTGRLYLEEEQKRMRRETPKKSEVPNCLQVCNDQCSPSFTLATFTITECTQTHIFTREEG